MSNMTADHPNLVYQLLIERPENGLLVKRNKKIMKSSTHKAAVRK